VGQVDPADAALRRRHGAALGGRDPGRIDPKAIRAALDRHGLAVVAHTAWFIPIGSPFGSVREASLAEFQWALRAAHQIGATVMNVHYGRSPGFFSKEQVVGWHAEVLSRLCQEATEAGVTIVLEHIPHGGRDQLENIVAIMDRVPLLRFHLDSGHAKLERGHDRWDEYLDKLGPRLRHVPLSENDGTADQHLPRGPLPEVRPIGRSTSRSSRPGSPSGGSANGAMLSRICA
jgi:sugar phosphate isomerase/epimerase